MRRRFRRRPPPSAIVLLLLLVLVTVRLWQDYSRRRDDVPTIQSLTEGRYLVQRVVDGDTLIVTHPAKRSSGGRTIHKHEQARVRLIGVDTPETVKPHHPVQPWGPQATVFTKRFVATGEVFLRLSRRRQDRYGRFLAYVFVNDRMLNEELARAGLARVKIYPGESSPLTRRLKQAEQEAKTAQRGIWSRQAPTPHGGNL